ncbi:MAG: GntR family transcriptional regulator [Saliniramus fredricksonii]|uniref:DNA-binding transcriptional regulator, GntR family n=1 Tax=Saliniramus fredricksonii TaxID=1653334 RepID=A0A0P7X3I1_9HYPH|nr:GntR family transcriptional regulator [Saliniramus fredricksonii]KPQ09103.1 MAG: GntR family transcriptional regulator [Saliniramus fredricksonii]SCC81630.1 DNA-binding transcriptional regulator, GntR family [Saliniramus fredricksonii]
MSGPVFGRIDQMTMRESVYAQLHDAFTRGQFAPGDSLNLRGLAERLGTSMTPVREAVRRLVAEGALIDAPSRSLRVPDFDLRQMEDLKLARIALEPLVTGRAVERMDDGTLEVLAAILAEEAEDGAGRDTPDLSQNYRFHFTLYQKADSPVLLPLIAGLWLRYGPYLNLIMRRAGPDIGKGNDIHEIILDAARRGDARTAQAAIVDDIERSFSLLAEAADAHIPIRQSNGRALP